MEEGWYETCIRKGRKNCLITALFLTAASIGIYAALDPTDEYYKGGLFWLWGFAIFAGGFWIMVFLNLGAIKRDTRYLELRKYGDPGKICEAINREFGLPETQKIGALTVCPNWLMQRGLLGPKIASIEEIVWAYRKETTTRSLVISVQNTACLHLKTGETFETSGSAEEVGAMLSLILERAPWVTLGYSDELKNSWSRERREFIAHVENEMQKHKQTERK